MIQQVCRFLQLLLLLALASNGFAQNRRPGVFVGANFLYNVPQGSFGGGYGKSPGVEAVGGVGIGKTFLQASYGSQRFVGKGANKDIVVKPLQLGLRQFILGKHVFVSAEMGKALVRNKSKDTEPDHLIHRFGGGVRLFGIEAGMYYSGWNDNTANQSFPSLQYKIGWNLLL